jgi:hypothetical protein
VIVSHQEKEQARMVGIGDDGNAAAASDSLSELQIWVLKTTGEKEVNETANNWHRYCSNTAHQLRTNLNYPLLCVFLLPSA